MRLKNTLESISEFDFIKESLKIDNTPFSYFGVECKEGWKQLIYDLCVRINQLEPDLRITQIKEKFGLLRIYTNSCSDKVDKLISETEYLSSTVCEVCGKKGEISSDGWVQVLCDKHKKEYLEHSNNNVRSVS